MKWLAALVLVGCGADKAHRNTVPTDLLDTKAQVTNDGGASRDAIESQPSAPPQQSLATLTIERACARFDELAKQHCEWTARFPPEFQVGNSCANSLQTWVTPANPTHDELQHMIDCWALDCDAAERCIVANARQTPPPPSRSCGEEGTAPIVVDEATWAKRRGNGATRFADVHSSQVEPVEVCGIDGEVAWMTTVACNNGSHPYRRWTRRTRDAIAGWPLVAAATRS